VSSLRNVPRLVPSPSLMAEERPRGGRDSNSPANSCRTPRDAALPSDRERNTDIFRSKKRGEILPAPILRRSYLIFDIPRVFGRSKLARMSKEFLRFTLLSARTRDIHQIRPYFHRKISFCPPPLAFSHLTHVAEDFLIRSSRHESLAIPAARYSNATRGLTRPLFAAAPLEKSLMN